MKFGCCGNLVANGKDKTGIEIIETIAKLGYDYIELPLAEMMALPQSVQNEYRQRVAASGIKCEVCNNLFPATIRLTGNDVDFAKIEEHATNALALADSFGAQVVVFGSSGAKNVPEGFSMDTAYEQVVKTTALLAPLAKKSNIVIVIEPIRKFECNIINTFSQGVQLAKEINSPNIKALIDYYHMTCENESLHGLLQYGSEYLHHIHFSYPNIPSDLGRTYPANLKEWSYSPFIDAIKQLNYTSRISIEAGVTNFDTQARDALAMLRSIF